MRAPGSANPHFILVVANFLAISEVLERSRFLVVLGREPDLFLPRFPDVLCVPYPLNTNALGRLDDHGHQKGSIINPMRPACTIDAATDHGRAYREKADQPPTLIVSFVVHGVIYDALDQRLRMSLIVDSSNSGTGTVMASWP